MAKNPQLVQTSSVNLGDLQAAMREWSQRLLQAPGASRLRALSVAAGAAARQKVVGVGIGEKLVDNKAAGVMAVKFLVQVKYTEGQMGTKDQLPKAIGGLPVDVEQVGLFRRFGTKAQ